MGISAKLMSLSKLLSRKGLARFLTEQLALVEPGTLVLNVGSGGEIQNLVGEAATQIGFTVTSTDIDPARGPDVVDDIAHSSFPDETFDAIVVMEVLEHVLDPLSAASEIHRLLKPGGRLILSVPFIFPLHDRPYDFFRYTRYGLAHLFRPFDELVVRERNSWGEAILVLVARLVKEPGRFTRLLSFLFLLLAFICLPFVILICRWAPTDFLTTGYVVFGRKANNKIS